MQNKKVHRNNIMAKSYFVANPTSKQFPYSIIEKFQSDERVVLSEETVKKGGKSYQKGAILLIIFFKWW